MKKVLSIVAVTLFSVGIYSYNECTVADSTGQQFQNVESAVATDGTILPIDRRNKFTDGTINPIDKRNT